MEALAEQHVATYLTRGGKVFIVPHYPIPSDNPDNDWSCPDFVALNFENPDRPVVMVVEVTTASNLETFLAKIRKRNEQWFVRLRAKLTTDRIINDNWSIQFLGFVRRANLPKAKDKFAGEPDVKFAAIEEATFSWNYWEDRKKGLP